MLAEGPQHPGDSHIRWGHGRKESVVAIGCSLETQMAAFIALQGQAFSTG